MDFAPPLVALAAAASSMLARALGACLASSGAAEEHTVVLELHQSRDRPGLMGLRVCDDGVPLPADARHLDRCCSGGNNGELARLLGHPMFAESSVLVQTTGLEEMVVRRYNVRAAPAAATATGGSTQLAVTDAGAAAKPPGSTLKGSVFEATLRLQHPQTGAASGGAGEGQEGDARAYVQRLLAEALEAQAGLLPACGQEVVSCLQQLLGMLRVLAPPVRLLMRLSGVEMQGPDGSLQFMSGSRQMDVPLDPGLDGLARFREGMAAEFLPALPAGCPPARAEAGQPSSVLDTAALGSSSCGPSSEEGEPAAVPAAVPGSSTSGRAAAAGAMAAPEGAAAAAAAAGPGQAADVPRGRQLGEVPPLTFLGVGEAGWGCPGAAQAFRGCKWTARAGVVLTMPDHATLAGGGPGLPGSSSGQEAEQASPGGGSTVAAQLVQPAPLPAGTPVFLFRSWGMQLEGQQAAVKGVEKCDWPNFGFQLESVSGGSADAPLSAVLRCTQPASGAALTAAVVHLIPSDYRAAAEGRHPPPLAGTYEARLVRAAVEGALGQLKQQCPAVVISRRERSLERSLPLLAKSLAGILIRSERSETYSGGGGAEEEGSVLQQACSLLRSLPHELQGSIQALLGEAVAAAVQQGEDSGGGAGATLAGEGDNSNKRARGQRQQQEAPRMGSQA